MTDDYDAECFDCKHLARDHLVDTPGDPMSYAPCTAVIGPETAWLTCDCRDYDGMDHPDRPSLADTVVYKIDGEVGYL